VREGRVMDGEPEVQPRKRGRPTASERRAREAEILAHVLHVFLHCGYGASTVDDLASAAQVTKRTLYTYYGDKAGLFAAMVTELAATVSFDATSDDDTLEVLAARIVSRVHSDELVGLHRLVIAESARFPELALILHSSGDARHIARLAEHIRAECGPASEPLAEPLFSLLLGEKHRRRLLGIDPAPNAAEAARHARAALAQLGLRPELAFTGMASGSLYPLLAKLETAGWLKRAKEDIDPSAAGRPARMHYTITGAAVAAARIQLAALSEQYRPPSANRLRPEGSAT
jgi:TetR/AcrR family transcriptional regulator, mexJK operon transcriptional repressor